MVLFLYFYFSFVFVVWKWSVQTDRKTDKLARKQWVFKVNIRIRALPMGLWSLINASKSSQISPREIYFIWRKLRIVQGNMQFLFLPLLPCTEPTGVFPDLQKNCESSCGANKLSEQISQAAISHLPHQPSANCLSFKNWRRHALPSMHLYAF